MLTLKGTPFSKIGEVEGDCTGPDISVPDICSECRQVTRWTKRTLSWASGKNTRFAAMVRAILGADDDILSALCGFCFLQDEESCSCFASKYTFVGLPLKVPVQVPGVDDCLRVFEEVVLQSSLGGRWKTLCSMICETEAVRELDPCGSASDLALMKKVYAVRQLANRQVRSGATLIEALSILFPGSSPVVVFFRTGVVYVSLGREMDDEEFQLREYLRSVLPVRKDVKVIFVERL